MQQYDLHLAHSMENGMNYPAIVFAMQLVQRFCTDIDRLTVRAQEVSVELYKNYNTLPISELHKYQLLMLVHKFVYHSDKLPPAFVNYFMFNCNVHSYNTRKNHDLHLQNLQSTVGKKMIKFKAIQLWNQFPNEVKEIKSESLFKSRITVYLYNKLYTEWQYDE